MNWRNVSRKARPCLPSLAICGLLGLLAVTPAAVQADRIHRDWTKYPAVLQVDTDQDVFVVGDPHADYPRLVTLLTGAKIASSSNNDKPEDVHWNAGKSVVVFTGDYIDKGPDKGDEKPMALQVISLVRSLQSEASNVGGRVVILMGNHEAEFLANPTEKKVSQFAGELEKNHLIPAEVAACKGDLGEFLCSLSFAARVNAWFFSHAGNTDGRTISKLIADLQKGVDDDGFATQQLIGDNSLLEARLGDCPWFERPGSEKDCDKDPQTTLTTFTQTLGVKHIVQGHQPGNVTIADRDGPVKRHKGEMFQIYGLIFLEDTGMSRGIDDSHGAVLRIPAGQEEAIAICYSGKATTIWPTQEKHGSIKPCGGK
jgi:hypothetical protein